MMTSKTTVIPETVGTRSEQGEMIPGRQWTVARTLRLGSAILLTLFVTAGFLSFYSVRSIGDSFDRVARVDQPLSQSVTGMIHTADAATIGVLEALVSNDPTAAPQAENAFDGYMSDFQAIGGHARLEGHAASAQGLFGRLKDVGRRLVARDQLQRAAAGTVERSVSLRGKSLTGKSEGDLRRFLRLHESLDRVLNDDIDDHVQTNLDRRTLQAQKVVDRSNVVLVAITIPALLLGFAAFVWVRRRITQPVQRLMRAIDSLRAGKILDDIELPGNDEFGVLARALTSAAEERTSLEGQLRYQAFHDPLTGVANRALFMERMEHAISRSDRRMAAISVLFIDLDEFKTVNDTMGHEAGDDLLRSVADRLTDCVRAEDTVARLGGDEFGVLLEDTDAEGASDLVERVARALSAPLTIGNGHVATSASVGLATRYVDEGVDALLARADTAMYVAKSRGQGLWQAFEPDMDAAIATATTLRAELQRAVRENEFVVHYQPIIDLGTQLPVAVEALVRWEHPQRGLLPPSEFLDAAEESGHILFIDKWVLHEACRQVRAWQTTLPNASTLSACVNLSARQLEHPGLGEEVDEALRSSGLAPEHLTIELTETVLVRDVDAAAVELRRLKELGVQIALDDFGTGYSSLSYLRRFPIDTLKIDRSFVSGTGQRPDQLEVALALVEFSRRLGLTTIAEGIEEHDQLKALSDLGCELGQGYLFAKPLGAEQLEAFLEHGVSAIVRSVAHAAGSAGA